MTLVCQLSIYSTEMMFYRKMTPLHVACENGLSDIVTLLLKSGTEVNLKNDFLTLVIIFIINFSKRTTASIILKVQREI